MSSVVNVRVAHIRPKYKNLQDWTNDANNIYIGRGRIVFIDGKKFPKQSSKWANPFKISHCTREASLIAYEDYILKKIQEDPTKYNLNELKGKTLGCWCYPKPCHGDILLHLCKESISSPPLTPATENITD